MLHAIMRFSIFLLIAFIGGCGDRVVEKEVPQQPTSPNPSPTNTPGGEKPTYAEMKTLLTEFCSACHSTAQFYNGGEAALRSSRARDYIWSRRMPPANAQKALPDAVRTQMLTFF